MKSPEYLGVGSQETRYEQRKKSDRDGQPDDERRHDSAGAPAGPTSGSSHAIAPLIADGRQATHVNPKRLLTESPA